MAKRKKAGPLSQMERYTIRGALQEGSTPEEIGEMLNRSPDTIRKFEEDYDNLIDNIVKAKMEAAEEPQEEKSKKNRYSNQDVVRKENVRPEEYEEAVPEVLYNAVMKSLMSKGVIRNDARALLSRVLEEAIKYEKRYTDEKSLFGACIRKMKAGNFIKKTTEGGHEGVAIMSKAASSKRDDTPKRPPKPVEHIYKPFG